MKKLTQLHDNYVSDEFSPLQVILQKDIESRVFRQKMRLKFLRRCLISFLTGFGAGTIAFKIFQHLIS